MLHPETCSCEHAPGPTLLRLVANRMRAYRLSRGVG